MKIIYRSHYRRKTVNRVWFDAQTVLLFITTIALFTSMFQNHKLEVSVKASESKIKEQQEKEIGIANQYGFKTYLKEIPTPYENMDSWVGQYIDKYFDKPYQQSEMRMIMQCLLNRESKHDADKGHGDNGMAGGPLQFWEDTWNRMRGQMLEQGLIDEIGSRYDQEQAIHTTVWAIKNGRAKEWGPILRWSNGKAYQHACPLPSWY